MSGNVSKQKGKQMSKSKKEPLTLSPVKFEDAIAAALETPRERKQMAKAKQE